MTHEHNDDPCHPEISFDITTNDFRSDENSIREWIAIEPPSRNIGENPPPNHSRPPSFRDSQFGIILRRQRQRPHDNSGLKGFQAVPTRFLHLTDSFEFAGWGSVSYLKLKEEDHIAGRLRLETARKEQVLGQFTASALAGNAVLGSVFYALPSVVAVAGVYSPISLFIATLIIFLWRPIMAELAYALPVSGAPYTYILNVSTKTLALVAATLLLLDFASTSITSAATAATYLAGEVSSLPFPLWVGTIIVLVLFATVSLTDVRESARIALAVLTLHMGTMFALVMASVVHWARIGNTQLKSNWHAGQPSPSHDISVARQIFYGVCLGMLGLTGFECIPAYISRIIPGRFPLVLRNLHIPAIIINTLTMVLVLAIIPLDKIRDSANILSVLAQLSAGRWLRIWIAIDAIIVLCAGVLTGILAACELLEQLAQHRILPKLFLRTLPISGSPFISVLSFTGFSGMIYATAGASLTIISRMFSLVWLTVMALFPLSLLLLRYNRRRLQRESKTRLTVIMISIPIILVIMVGNIAVDPTTAGYFAAYFCGIVVLFSATQNKILLLRLGYWLFDQYSVLHHWRLTKMWGTTLINWMTTLKGQPVCILTKTDEINHLFHMTLYVRRNEETSCLKIVHFYEEEDGVPSELEANAKILDEAFPEITIDLILVNGVFEPKNVAALAHHLNVSPSLMFMSCPGAHFSHNVAEFGTRIITR